MKKIILFIVTLIFVFSCKEIKEKESNNNLKQVKNQVDSIPKLQAGNDLESLECEDKDTLQYQNENISIYNEFKIRGKGVLTLTIKDKVTFFNEDDSVFGEIIMNEQSDYTFNTPNRLVVRSIVPPFDLFLFDSNLPKENDEFLRVYVNKELKKIKKNQVDYNFEKWNDYIKKSFIKIRNCNSKDLNTYEVTSIKDDLIEIRSLTKESCDAIDSYNKSTKEIKWKNDQDILLINFFTCN